jgi:hypothetical protein
MSFVGYWSVTVAIDMLLPFNFEVVFINNGQNFAQHKVKKAKKQSRGSARRKNKNVCKFLSLLI